MKAPILAAAVLAALAGDALAESRYDRKLEAAVLNIVASRIGDLRGGLRYDAVMVLPEATDALITGSVASPSTVIVGAPRRKLNSQRRSEASRVVLF